MKVMLSMPFVLNAKYKPYKEFLEKKASNLKKDALIGFIKHLIINLKNLKNIKNQSKNAFAIKPRDIKKLKTEQKNQLAKLFNINIKELEKLEADEFGPIIDFLAKAYTNWPYPNELPGLGNECKLVELAVWTILNYNGRGYYGYKIEDCKEQPDEQIFYDEKGNAFIKISYYSIAKIINKSKKKNNDLTTFFKILFDNDMEQTLNFLKTPFFLLISNFVNNPDDKNPLMNQFLILPINKFQKAIRNLDENVKNIKINIDNFIPEKIRTKPESENLPNYCPYCGENVRDKRWEGKSRCPYCKLPLKKDQLVTKKWKKNLKKIKLDRKIEDIKNLTEYQKEDLIKISDNEKKQLLINIESLKVLITAFKNLVKDNKEIEKMGNLMIEALKKDLELKNKDKKSEIQYILTQLFSKMKNGEDLSDELKKLKDYGIKY